MIVLLVGLSACASTGGKVRHEARSIAEQPLNDLNVMQGDIPANLVAIENAPYAPPGDCASIDAEIDGLNLVLGPDLDTVPLHEQGPIISRKTVGDAALNAVRDAAVGWIPFRGVIRTVSGAERHARRVRDAILAGTVRRAYLKGYRARLDCAPPPRDIGPVANSD